MHLLPVFRPRKSTQQPYPNHLPFPHVDIPKRKSLEHNPSLQMSASETNRFQSDFVEKEFFRSPLLFRVFSIVIHAAWQWPKLLQMMQLLASVAWTEKRKTIRVSEAHRRFGIAHVAG